LGEGPVVAAYEASAGAARALHMLLLLCLAEGRPLHVASVDADREAATRTARLGTALAARHGVAAHPHGVQGETASALLAEIEALRPALVVMGAHHRGPPTWREWLFGTTATSLLEQVECPVLVST
jgi:nucleotide-binding universal stress UspA family protein